MTFGQWLAVAILSFLLGLVISIGNNWRYQVPRGRRYHLAFASLMVVVCVPVCLLIDTCQTMFSLSIPTRRFAWGFYVQWRQIQPVGAIQWAAYGAFHALMAVPLGLLPFLLPALRGCHMVLPINKAIPMPGAFSTRFS